ncbi:MAG: RNase P subunit p30 family protein [Candidatus Woesearchaeota archaeon]
MIDIVFPEKNEKEFFAVAQKIGYTGLVLVYPSVDAARNAPKPPTGLKVRTALLADPKRAHHLRSKGFMVFVKCSDQDRVVLERGSADVIFSAESTQPKDYTHQRGSGLNHVLCDLAKKNKVAIGFSFSDILASRDSQRVQLIGRMMQNIMLCRKYKVRMVIGSFAKDPWKMRSPHDLKSFFIVLGMHPEEAASALSL